MNYEYKPFSQFNDFIENKEFVFVILLISIADGASEYRASEVCTHKTLLKFEKLKNKFYKTVK